MEVDTPVDDDAQEAETESSLSEQDSSAEPQDDPNDQDFVDDKECDPLVNDEPESSKSIVFLS
jgi:hypothetical protein